MPAFISSISSSAGVASRASTMRSTLVTATDDAPEVRRQRHLDGDESHRGPGRILAHRAFLSLRAAALASPAACRRTRRESGRPDAVSARSSATLTAWPVPSCSACSTLATPKPATSPSSSALTTTKISSTPAPRSARNHVPQHRPAAELVQHLRACALHARALYLRPKRRARIMPPPSVALRAASSASRSRSRTRSRPSSSIES